MTTISKDTDLRSAMISNYDDYQVSSDKQNLPLDYFNWGRDPRHLVDNTEALPTLPQAKNFLKKYLKEFLQILKRKLMVRNYYLNQLKRYNGFNETYSLMSDEYSRTLFSELLSMQILGEKEFRLSSFDATLVAAYEEASEKILGSSDVLSAYKWELRKVFVDSLGINLYTGPDLLHLVYTGRLYRYSQGDRVVEMEPGDIVLDCGVGWGDTTVSFAAIVESLGEVHCFELNQEGLDVLKTQVDVSGTNSQVIANRLAVSDTDGEQIFIGEASPATRITENRTTGTSVTTTTIDTYCMERGLARVDFIKMDIEGAEMMALRGACETIAKFKPKLAISAYHKWDDLREIPKLIKTIRTDYEFYLDCSTGFGGEAVLYCK